MQNTTSTTSGALVKQQGSPASHAAMARPADVKAYYNTLLKEVKENTREDTDRSNRDAREIVRTACTTDECRELLESLRMVDKGRCSYDYHFALVLDP